MATKVLIREDGLAKYFEVRDVDGAVLHQVAEAKLTPAELNEAMLRDRAGQALQANATFLGLGAPTNGQTLAQVQRLTRETSAIIRLLLGQLDTTDGT